MRFRSAVGAGFTAFAAAASFIAAESCAEKSIRVETTEVSVGDIVETIPAGGRIFPTVEVEISAEVSGEIVRLDCYDGKQVRKGDTLLVIKQEPYIAEVESAEASLRVLEAECRQQHRRAEQAWEALERVRSLAGKGGISESELKKSEADSAIASDALEAAFNSVRRGQAALNRAKEDLALTTITSPMNGTVTYLSVKKGERIVGTSQMAGTLIMKIADLGAMALRADISENDIGSIHIGDSVEVSVEAYRNRKLKGVVTHIANSSKFIDGSFGQVANFEVQIRILPPESHSAAECGGMRLRPGMSASASITSSRHNDILKLPARSIFVRDGKESVWTVDDGGRVRIAHISTGIQDLDSIEVTSGLKQGDKVVTAPVTAITTQLSEGMKTTD